MINQVSQIIDSKNAQKSDGHRNLPPTCRSPNIPLDDAPRVTVDGRRPKLIVTDTLVKATGNHQLPNCHPRVTTVKEKSVPSPLLTCTKVNGSPQKTPQLITEPSLKEPPQLAEHTEGSASEPLTATSESKSNSQISEDSFVTTSQTLKRVMRSEGFYLEAKLEGVNILFTIDTGATRTIISERVYKSIPDERRPQLKKSVGLTDASGHPLSQLGTAVFEVQLANGVQFSGEIIVADIEDEGLFGHDLLKQGQSEILYEKYAIRFMGVQIPCVLVGGASNVRKVVSADRFTIPGYCEKIIDVFVRISPEDNIGTVLLEPCTAFQDKYGLIMASSLSDLQNKVTHKVRLLNPGPVDVAINQDVTIGIAEAVCDVSTFMDYENEADRVNMSSVRRIGSSLARLPKSEPAQIRRIQDTIVPGHLVDLLKTAGEDCTEDEKAQIAKMLSDYQDTFSKDEFDLGLTNLIEHSIDVGNSKPIKQPPRRVPVAFAAEEEKVIQQLQKQWVIRKSTSPWASPICLVRKKIRKSEALCGLP